MFIEIRIHHFIPHFLTKPDRLVMESEDSYTPKNILVTGGAGFMYFSEVEMIA